MSAAVTTGVVALVIEANRYAAIQTRRYYRLKPNTIKAILQYTVIAARDVDGQIADELTQGAGAIDPLGAAALAAGIAARS